jgi:hypothetical protein
VIPVQVSQQGSGNAVEPDSSKYPAEAHWLELWGCKPGGPRGPRRPGRQCRFCRPVQDELSGHIHRANGIVCAGFTGSPSREEKHAGGWNRCPPRESGYLRGHTHPMRDATSRRAGQALQAVSRTGACHHLIRRFA